jgi:hypothetical protein
MSSSIARMQLTGDQRSVKKNALRIITRQIINAKLRGVKVPRSVTENFMHVMKSLYPRASTLNIFSVFVDIISIHSPNMHNRILRLAVLSGPESRQSRNANRVFNHIRIANNGNRTVNFNLNKLLRSHNLRG